MSWKRELLLSSDWILMQCEIINSHFPSNITRALDVTQYTRARVLSSSIMRNSNDDETSQSIRQIKRLNIFFYLTEKLNHFLVASHSRAIAVQHFRQHNMPQLIIGRWILMSFSVYSWNERQQKNIRESKKLIAELVTSSQAHFSDENHENGTASFFIIHIFLSSPAMTDASTRRATQTFGRNIEFND